VSALSRVRAGNPRHWEITRQTLRASRRTLIIWAASFAGLIAVYAVIWPSVRGNTSWRNLFDTLPQTYRALFTASGTIDLSTAGGYLGVELMGFMGPALIAVYAITAGAAAIAGEEDRGGLEVTLSAPISRPQLFLQRLTALVIGIATLMTSTGAALWIFSALLDMSLGAGAIASGAAALGIFGLFTGTVAIAVGGATGSASAARGAAALVAVASYLINALAQITGALRPARPISPYYLVLGNEPLAHGLRLIGAVAVLAAAAALAAIGGILFTRRDLK
jgi:ABC-2 type transport system permease protein